MQTSTFLGQALPGAAQTASAPAARGQLQVQASFLKNIGNKAAPKKAAKKASAPARVSSGTKRTKGWFGGEGGAEDLDKWYGPSRRLYLPSGLLDPSEVPDYLNGELPGDYGYDPLGLGKDPETVAKYRANELLHARWAMLFTAGAIIPEGLAYNGADVKGATWFQTQNAMLDGGLLNYFVVPFALLQNPLPLVVIGVINVGLMAAVENFRARGEGPAGYSPGIGKFDADIFDSLDSLYPGGPFDPLGLADDPEVLAELKVKEIKNGRLAMVAALGFFIQAKVTGEGPYANIAGHLNNPFGYNLLTIIRGDERAPTL